MKKLIFVFLLTSFFASPAFSHELSFKLGASFAEPMVSHNRTTADFNNGNYVSKFSQDDHFDVDLVAPAITVDFYYYLLKNLHIGAGLNTELFRHTESSLGDISYFTPYVSVKPNIDVKDFKFYGLFKLGTTFLTYENLYNDSIDTKQKVSYALGSGVEYKNFVFEFVYNIIKYKVERQVRGVAIDSGNQVPFKSNTNSDRTQHTYTFNIGYKINIFN